MLKQKYADSITDTERNDLLCLSQVTIGDFEVDRNRNL